MENIVICSGSLEEHSVGGSELENESQSPHKSSSGSTGGNQEEGMSR